MGTVNLSYTFRSVHLCKWRCARRAWIMLFRPTVRHPLFHAVPVAIATAMIFMSPSTSVAIPVSIINHSFEDVVLPDGYYTVDNIPGWQGEASWYHIANPTDLQFQGATDGDSVQSTLEGRNAAAVNEFGHIL